MWWTVFTIVLGSIVLGTLLPVFLVVAALGTLLIPFLAIREQRTLRRARRELIEQREVLLESSGPSGVHGASSSSSGKCWTTKSASRSCGAA